MSLIGIVVLFLIGYALSTARRAINWRTILGAFAFQVFFAAFALYVPWGQGVMASVSEAVSNLEVYGNQGISFLFGGLNDGALMHQLFGNHSFIFALKVLPLIVFFSGLMAVLYHIGVMGVINMAHGEMVMIGAYSTFVVQEIIRNHAPGLFDWSLAIALPVAFLVTGAIGFVLERGIIRFLYGRPLETLLATWGVSLMLQQAVRSIFGPTNQEVGNPSWMSGSFALGGLNITYNRMWIIAFSLVIFFALLVVMKRSAYGLNMRAVTQNRRMASSMGIRTPWVDALTFALGSGIAGIAGVALSQIDNVSPNLGQSYIIDSFMVVVFGGVGNLWGTLVGALSLGVLNKFLEPSVGAVLGKILVLVLIILFIQKRPRGLFALKGRAVEA